MAPRGHWRPLAWVFCLLLAFSVLPVLPATCAAPADCGDAGGRPCCGCCAAGHGGAEMTGCKRSPPVPAFHGAGCELADRTSPAEAAQALRPLGLKLIGDGDTVAGTSSAAPAAAAPLFCGSTPRPASHAPPGHCRAPYTGRAPPSR